MPMPTGPGAPTLYKHYGRKPEHPASGWKAARLSKRNPAYVYLKEKLADGTYTEPPTILHTAPPHLVYNAHDIFYSTSPYKWAEFFKKVVFDVLDITIDIDSAADTASAAAADAADDDEEEEEEEEEDTIEEANDDRSSSHRPTPSYLDPTASSANMSDIETLDGSVTSSFLKPIVDDRGTVVHAVPFAPLNSNNGPNTRVHLQSWSVPWSDGRGETLTPSNTGMIRSIKCHRTLVMIHHKGAIADSKKIAKAFTRGTHEIIMENGKKKKLKLQSTDVNVVNLTSYARKANGEVVNGLTAFCVYQPFKFKKPVKNLLVSLKASNNTELPKKYAVAPDDATDVNGVHVLAFNVEYEASDEGTMNM